MSGRECQPARNVSAIARNLGYTAQPSKNMTESICRRVALGLLRGYKLVISPWIAPACRFTPTCSEYASDAIERYGVLKGTAKAMRRLLSCHPFHRGGWDPA